MKTLSSIVVGIDFSECSRVALVHALRLASWSGAAVHPVHVVETGIDEGDESQPTDGQDRARDGLVAAARSRWQEFSQAVPAAGGVLLSVAAGSRLQGIRREIALREADLLVLGAFGAVRPNVGLGTLTSACLRGAPTDVLVVRDNYREPFRTVAVGIDFSAASQRALEAAALVARHEGATLRAVHVAPATAASAVQVEDEWLSQLERFVQEMPGRDAGLDVRCHVYPYWGQRSGILEFATLVNADLIVVGTKGRTNLREVVLGTTAEKVLRESLVAVWAARQ